MKSVYFFNLKWKNIWKVYFFQISSYFEKILLRYQFGFWKGYNAHKCLLIMIEKWQMYLKLLLSFSWSLIEKLHANVFDTPALRLLYNYHTNRIQRVNIDHTFSFWEEDMICSTTTFNLGLLLFNNFLSDLFLFINDTDISSYADYNTP